MRRFFGSANGRFFAVLLEREVTVYRADIVLWSRDIDLTDFTVLRLGNHGQLFVLAPQGLYIWPHDPTEPPTLLEHFSAPALAKVGSTMGRVKVGKEGTAVCVELITASKESLKQKLLPAARPDTDRVHEFLFFDVQSGRQTVFQKVTVPHWIGDAVCWDLSIDFRWMAYAVAGKGSRHALKIVVHDLQDEHGRQEIALDGLGFRSLSINRDGTVCIDTLHQGEGKLHLVTRGGVRSLVTPPSAYGLAHFGRTYMALNLTPIPHVLFKDYRDRLVAHVDLGSLKKLGMEWSLHFDERDEINLLTWRDGTFRFVHTRPDRIAMDAKRWDFLANSQNLFKMEGEVRRTVYDDGMPTENPQRDADRRRHHQELSKNLANSVNQIKHDRNEEAAQAAARLRRELEALRMAFATGQMSKADFERDKDDLERQIGQQDQIVAEEPPRRRPPCRSNLIGEENASPSPPLPTSATPHKDEWPWD